MFFACSFDIEFACFSLKIMLLNSCCYWIAFAERERGGGREIERETFYAALNIMSVTLRRQLSYFCISLVLSVLGYVCKVRKRP